MPYSGGNAEDEAINCDIEELAAGSVNMGRKSTKTNKSYYQLLREEKGLTREKASDLMQSLISPEKLEKIENGKTVIQPEDIVLLADCYKSPSLCNYYCTKECAIGREHIAEIPEKDLPHITVEMLHSLNLLNIEQNRLIEIAEDGAVANDELEDFMKIKAILDKMALSVSSLQLWIDKTIEEHSR